ncbi:type II toxin-antitoxin system HigA family antitoxin [Methylovirgula sp. HY1]|uniref:helix-turn-helix domain-containing protein n=1 Tax=Methylovirgula sp. HY1 TaxID=2822761 RepID=UPI001C5BEC73|nr:transcriptional regulator [Methylovirgula sp. HY1]QXX74325.1 hypothetical protein MHY1_01136 [Methylovirgula sp. HY1]
MEIRPITNDEEHSSALRSIETLWNAPEGSKARHELDAIATLIDAYERKRWPVREADPVKILQQAIVEGRTQAELATIIGSRARASELLNRNRALTIKMIDKISKAWKIPRQLLAVPYQIKKKAAAHKSKLTRTPRKGASLKTVTRKRA